MWRGKQKIEKMGWETQGAGLSHKELHWHALSPLLSFTSICSHRYGESWCLPLHLHPGHVSGMSGMKSGTYINVTDLTLVFAEQPLIFRQYTTYLQGTVISKPRTRPGKVDKCEYISFSHSLDSTLVKWSLSDIVNRMWRWVKADYCTCLLPGHHQRATQYLVTSTSHAEVTTSEEIIA